MSDDDPFEALDDLDADADTDVDPDALFSEVDVDDVDEAAVWEELVAVGAETDEPAGPDSEGVVVPKDDYCRGCEHFSSPPTVACDSAGTDIVELVDVDHLRVVDCPVVEQRRDATGGVFRTDDGK
jgi:hypothetical protein